MAPVVCIAPAQLGAAFLRALRYVTAHLVHLYATYGADIFEHLHKRAIAAVLPCAIIFYK